jgi:hypothetical protein
MIQFWCRCCDHGWRERMATSAGPTRCARCQAQQVMRYVVEAAKSGGADRRENQAARSRRFTA